MLKIYVGDELLELSDEDYIGDIIRDTVKQGETIRQYVKRIRR